MKKYFNYIILLSVFFSVACTTEDTGKEKKQTREASAAASTGEGEKVLVLPWSATLNPETEELELKHNPVGDPSKLTLQDMIDAINLKYPQIGLEMEAREGETLYVSVNDANYLTQQMGSAGAEAYLAETTFALTELKGITAVGFNFKAGDHATPKIYSRKDFSDF